MEAFCSDHFELFTSRPCDSLQSHSVRKVLNHEKEKLVPPGVKLCSYPTSRQLNQSDAVQPVPLSAHLTRQGPVVMSSKRIIRLSYFDFDCFKTSYTI